MGREKVLEIIKKKYFRRTVLCGVFGLLCIIGGLFMPSPVYKVFAFLLAGVMFWLVTKSYGHSKDPYTSDEIKKNAQLLDMADEHFAHITYQDKFITLSDRMVSSTKDASQIAFLEEIYMLHIQKNSMNFVPTGKDLLISHARGRIEISVYGVKKSTIDELFRRFQPICPNACAGYTQDNLKYLNYKRQQWASGVGVVPINRPEATAETNVPAEGES